MTNLATQLSIVSEEVMTSRADKIIEALTAEAKKQAQTGSRVAKHYDPNLTLTEVKLAVMEHFESEGFKVLIGSDTMRPGKLEPVVGSDTYVQVSWP